MTALINIFPCADDMISEIMLAGHFVKKKMKFWGPMKLFAMISNSSEQFSLLSRNNVNQHHSH